MARATCLAVCFSHRTKLKSEAREHDGKIFVQLTPLPVQGAATGYQLRSSLRKIIPPLIYTGADR